MLPRQPAADGESCQAGFFPGCLAMKAAARADMCLFFAAVSLLSDFSEF